jgi:hypothetical protein
VRELKYKSYKQLVTESQPLLVILALPLFWWTISVWRCSSHASRIWATMARFLTVAVYYEYSLRLLIGYYYPQIWFNCQQLIIEYGFIIDCDSQKSSHSCPDTAGM